MSREKTIGLLAMQAVLIVAAGPVGCLITPPIRTTTAVKTASDLRQDLPKQLPIPGKTTRLEVEEQYSAFAVPSAVPDLFLAQYNESTWAMAAGAAYAGGYAGRIWTTHNILATFDKNGVLKTFDVLSDRDLIARFEQMQKDGAFPLLDLSKPIRIVCDTDSSPPTILSLGVESYSAIVLSSTTLTLEPAPPSATAPPHSASKVRELTIPIDEIIAIGSGDGLQLKLSRKIQSGNTIEIHAPAGQWLTIVRWFQQAKGAGPAEAKEAVRGRRG